MFIVENDAARTIEKEMNHLFSDSIPIPDSDVAKRTTSNRALSPTGYMYGDFVSHIK
jgi:hypothetical protein